MDVELDASQRAVAERLDVIARRAEGRWRKRHRGLYLWGPVGRGKTILMDAFFERMRVPKMRVHFHEFLDDLHRDVHALGSVDRAVAHRLDGVKVLCFDEFHVHDVGDARLMTRLLDHLDRRGTVLVATSNYPPQGLLPHPLFHHVFAPSIEWIERNLDVMSLDAGIDYRTRSGSGVGDDGFASGRYIFDRKPALPAVEDGQTLYPSGHGVRAISAYDGVIWFDFADLCDTPTAVGDYRTLAGQYSDWTISGVPAFEGLDLDPVRRFGNVVDVLYDADIVLTVIADVPFRDLTTEAGELPIWTDCAAGCHCSPDPRLWVVRIGGRRRCGPTRRAA